MIKVTALTSSRDDPSTRFRVRQFIQPLREHGVEVAEYYPLFSKYKIEPLPLLTKLLRVPGLLASQSSDITWLGRELLSGRSGLERRAGTKRLFDVDDAIWLVYPQSNFSEEIARDSAGVIAGNSFLAAHYEEAGARVWTVPTSIDTNIWQPSEKQASDVWTIGWTGTWSNLKYLSEIEQPLADFLATHAESRLLVVSDRRPAFSKIPAARWSFVQWSPASEVRAVQAIDVGLMPLADTEWARGKCAFKMLSYMSVGLPVVASPFGVNREILQTHDVGFAATVHDDWHEALLRLYDDRALASRLGRNGRAVVEEHFSVNANAAKLAAIFREVAAE